MRVPGSSRKSSLNTEYALQRRIQTFEDGISHTIFMCFRSWKYKKTNKNTRLCKHVNMWMEKLEGRDLRMEYRLSNEELTDLKEEKVTALNEQNRSHKETDL